MYKGRQTIVPHAFAHKRQHSSSQEHWTMAPISSGSIWPAGWLPVKEKKDPTKIQKETAGNLHIYM